MSKVYGTFVFERMGDGCLSSKYCHTASIRPFSETCTSVEYPAHNNFEGHYYTVWLEEGGNPINVVQATLMIQPKANGMFDLTWNLPSGGGYAGIGMLYNELLVGHYWSN